MTKKYEQQKADEQADNDIAREEGQCRCREPKRHRDCLYCGMGGACTHVCGECKEAGVDGPVIRGTERRVCRLHKITS